MSKQMGETAMLATLTKQIQEAAATRPALNMRLNEAASTANNISVEEMLARAESGGVGQSNPPLLPVNVDSAEPVLVDPRRIRASRYANRIMENFGGIEFEAFKDEIASAGGNTVPVKLRKMAHTIDGYDYELVFGHRRHAACLQLGLQVTAFVSSMDDATLFIEMERENRGRKDLSAWEQGVSYARALDDGLFLSARKLADSINMDVGHIGKAIALARLPSDVVGAFSSPLDIQFRFSKPLKDAIEKDPEGVLLRAREIKAEGQSLSAKDVVTRLLESKVGSVVATPKVKKVSLKGKGGQYGEIQFNRSKRSAVITVENVDPSRFNEVQELITGFLGRTEKNADVE